MGVSDGLRSEVLKTGGTTALTLCTDTATKHLSGCYYGTIIVSQLQVALRCIWSICAFDRMRCTFAQTHYTFDQMCCAFGQLHNCPITNLTLKLTLALTLTLDLTLTLNLTLLQVCCAVLLLPVKYSPR